MTPKPIQWMLLLLVVLLPVSVHAAFEHENILDTTVDASIRDVVTDPEGKLVYLLTPDAVLLFSTKEQSVVGKIPVSQSYDRITLFDKNRLVLTDGKSSRIRIVQVNRIYDIDLEGRTVKGSRDAKASLVVFDDYQ